jgi:sirohydrochlorin ferrochelatase
MRYPPLSAGGQVTASAGPAPPPLIAVAHGSSDPRAAASVSALLDLVRQRAETAGFPGLDVRAAYLGHAAPSLAQALATVDGATDGDGHRGHGEAVVLPLLLTAAYHSKADIPGVLREARTDHPRLAVSYGQPLGPHPLLLRALERRLGEIPSSVHGGVALDPGETAVVLAAAGSSDSAAGGVVAGLAARWRARRGWRAVLPAYASAAAPTPADAVTALRRSGARHVLVATYLLSPGIFADQVRRDCLAAGAAGVSPVLGAAPEIADVVLGRYAETLADGRVAAAS